MIDMFETYNDLDNFINYQGHYKGISLEIDTNLIIKNCLIEGLNEYVEKHKFIKYLYAEWSFTKTFNVQKYLPGRGYTAEHTEHGNESFDSKRLLAWMIYLNDIKKGGGTRWPQQKYTSTAKQGDLYIWPAAWTHSHYGIIAPKETKYIVTGWCSYL
jgi:hypothetical protein